MASLMEHITGLHARTRYSARPIYLVVRAVGWAAFRAYGKLQRFELPSSEPHTFRYLTSIYEPGTTALVKSLLKPGMVAVDVGAHAGYYTRLFAKLVGSGGAVYAFEPAREMFSLLERNTAMYPNVNRYKMALLDKGRDVVFYESSNSVTNSLWENNPRGQSTSSNRVRAATLDEIIQDVCPDLVKIDVEGAELEVLKGMEKILSRPKSPVLIVEYNSSCLCGRGLDPTLLPRNLADRGFKLSLIHESNRMIEPIDADSVSPSLKNNLLCQRA